MLMPMSEPQQPPVPPYGQGAGQSAPGQPEQLQGGHPGQPQGGHPGQPTHLGQPAPVAPDQPAQPVQQNAPYAGQQPYGGQPYYSASTAPSGSGNSAGKIGFIVGLVSLGLSLLIPLIMQFLYRSDGWQAAQILNGANLFISLIGSAAALVLGIIGLRRRGAPHGMAGIAVGLGIAGVAGALVSMLIGAFSWVLYL